MTRNYIEESKSLQDLAIRYRAEKTIRGQILGGSGTSYHSIFMVPKDFYDDYLQVYSQAIADVENTLDLPEEIKNSLDFKLIREGFKLLLDKKVKVLPKGMERENIVENYFNFDFDPIYNFRR